MNFIQRIRKLLHWESTPKPKISLSTELYTQLKPFRLPIILIQLCMMIGVIGYITLEDYTLMEAIFQSGYTFTTTGFGALRESEFKAPTIVFTVFLMIMGLLVMTFAIGIIIDVINKGVLSAILKERAMLYKIARLKNHFVICYHNEYTMQLAEQFREHHTPFVVVDPNEQLEDFAKKNRYPYYIKDEPHTNTAILKTQLSSAKGIIALSKNIADNIAVIVSARLYEKELGRSPYFIITSADNESDIEKLKKLGANIVISATKLMAQRVSAMAFRPDMENILEQFLYKKDTPLDMEEISVPRHSWMVMRRLKEAHLRDITNVSIVGIREKDGKFLPMPKGDVIITSECKLLVIGTSNSITDTKRLIRKKEKPEELKYV